MVARHVSVLCAHRRSVYCGFDDVTVYDDRRDARLFDGVGPVVAHPPCRAWSAFTRHQAKPPADEILLWPWCVAVISICGGVLEHPAYSRLFDFCDIPTPGESPRRGLWSMAIDQSWFGFCASKRTWLVFSGIDRDQLPPIPFRLHNPHGDRRRWQVMSRRQRAATSEEFARWLVDVARLTRRTFQ